MQYYADGEWVMTFEPYRAWDRGPALEMLTIALGIGLTEDLIAGPLLTVPIPARLAATM